MPYFLTSDNVRLHYDDEGSGPCMVFIHGYTGSAQDWAGLRKSLSAQYRCIAIDRRWHGQSECPAYGLSIARQAVDVHELILTLAISNVCLVGHSMGAGVLWSYLDLFGSRRVSRAVSIDQSPRLINDAGWPLGMFGLTPEAAIDFSLASVAHLFEVRIAQIDDPLLAPLPPGAALPAGFAEGTATMLRDFVYADAVPGLQKIEVPYLAVHGKHSQFYPNDSGRWICDHVQRGHWALYEHCDHLVPSREPERLAYELATFLQV